MAKRKYTSRRPSTTSEQYLDDISRGIDQSIDIASTNNPSRVGVKLVSQTPIKAQIGEDMLMGRHTLQVINDSSFLIYIGFDENMVVGVDAVLVNSGSALTINLNPNKRVEVWVVSPDIDTEIKIIEVS